MNFDKYLLLNYRNFLVLALISVLLLSCQNREPLSYFQKDSHSIGYKKINIGEATDLNFGENSILNHESDDNLELILPEIKSFSKCEIYYSYFDKKSYTLLIVCKGLGESFKKRMVQEKDMRNFSINEIFSDSRWFITPLDANNILISTDVNDIAKAIKRNDDESLIFNETLFELKKELPQTSSEWFITNDKALMALLFKPFIKDSLSELKKIQENFTSLIFFKEPLGKKETKSTIIIVGNVREETNNNIVTEIESELSSMEHVRASIDSENYNFLNVNVNNINNKFKIKIN
jgi:hypothetical protein